MTVLKITLVPLYLYCITIHFFVSYVLIHVHLELTYFYIYLLTLQMYVYCRILP